MNNLTTLALVLLLAFVISACGKDSTPRPTCALEVTEPGEVILDRDITLTPGQTCAIGVFAHDVTIRLNGHTLKGLGAQDFETWGIYSRDVSFVRVEGPGLIQDFAYGVALTDSAFGAGSQRDLSVEGVTVERATYMGILIESERATVRDSSISNTGGRSFQGLHYVYGVEVRGRSCLLEGNRVHETVPDRASAEGVALSFSTNNDGCVARRNVVTQVTPSSDKNTFGTWVDVYSHVTFEENDISGMHYSGVVPTWTVIAANNTLDRPMIHAITDRP